MKAIAKALLAVLFLTSIISCIDVIDLDINTEQRTIIIDGIVTDSLDDAFVRLNYSSVIGIGNDNILDPIPNAQVKLVDESDNKYDFEEVESGVYKINYALTRNKDYHLEVILEDGSHYESEPSSLQSSSVIDSIKYEVYDGSYTDNSGQFTESTKIKLSCFSSFTDNDRPYLRWRINGMYEFQEAAPGVFFPERCYITNNIDLNKIRIFNSNELNGSVLFDQEIFDAIYDFRFIFQYAVLISQYSISEDEYDYWNNIKQIIDVEGGLFDPPPGTVVGNIRNVNDPNETVVGYFSISSLTRLRYFVSSNTTGIGIDPYCTGATWRPNGYGCEDCLQILNSTKEKPDFWEP